jgi:signal transduction histidine kinase
MIEGFCLDITEKILAEKEVEKQHTQLIQADKMITMGVLTAGIAHEINNPNTYIISSAEILADAWHDASYVLDNYHENQDEDVLIGGMPYAIFKDNLPALTERIISGSRRINRIIKELLDYSRKDSIGTNELVDVNRVMTSVETLLSSTIRKSTKHFSMNLTSDCPLIRANFLRLEQVVINLIQNACQALPNTNCGIVVSTRYLAETHEVLIVCQDEGIGISQENLKMVTEPFFTTKREVSGTGLGLAISSSIMRDLGGTMSFDSKVGKGTTVILKFPEEQKNN